MKKKDLFLILTTAFMAACFYSPLFAAGGEAGTDAIIGMADLDAIYAFHPLMQYYDKNAGLFIKPFEGTPTAAELLKAATVRNDEYQKNKDSKAGQLNKTKALLQEAEKELKNIENRYSAETIKINEKLKAEIMTAKTPESKQAKQKELQAELGKVQMKINEETEKQKAAVAELSLSFERSQTSLMAYFYQNEAETSATFDKINAEIKETIIAVASKKGLRAVVNSSGMAASPKTETGAGERADDPEKLKKLDDILKKGPDYSDILNILQIADTRDADEKGPSEARGRLEKIYSKRKEITEQKSGGALASSSVITGGADITAAVAANILFKYKVPKENIERIVEILSKPAGNGERRE